MGCALERPPPQRDSTSNWASTGLPAASSMCSCETSTRLERRSNGIPLWTTSWLRAMPAASFTSKVTAEAGEPLLEGCDAEDEIPEDDDVVEPDDARDVDPDDAEDGDPAELEAWFDDEVNTSEVDVPVPPEEV